MASRERVSKQPIQKGTIISTEHFAWDGSSDVPRAKVPRGVRAFGTLGPVSWTPEVPMTPKEEQSAPKTNPAKGSINFGK